MVEKAIACKCPNLNYSVKEHFLIPWGALGVCVCTGSYRSWALW